MKTKAQELTGPALTWAVCQAEGWRVVVVVVDGEAQVWHADDVSRYNPRCHNGSGDKPRFLVNGEPVGIFGCPIELGGEWFLRTIQDERLELRPGLYNASLWSCWGQTAHGERNSQQGKTADDPLTAVQRCFVAMKLGDKIELPKELT